MDLKVSFWCTVLAGGMAAAIAGVVILAAPAVAVDHSIGKGLLAGGLVAILVSVVFLALLWLTGDGKGKDGRPVDQRASQKGKHNKSTQQSAGDHGRNVNMPGGTYNEAALRSPSPYPKSVRNKDESLGVTHDGVWWQLRNWTKYRETSDWWMVMEARCLDHKQHILIYNLSDGWERPATDPNTERWSHYALSRLLKCSGDDDEHFIRVEEWRSVCAAARTKFDRAAELANWTPPDE